MKQKLILSIVLVLLFMLLAGCSGKNQTIADGLYLPISETTEWTSLEFNHGQLIMENRNSGIISTFDYTFKWETAYNSYMLSYEVEKGIDRWNVTIIDDDTIKFSGTVGTFVRHK